MAARSPSDTSDLDLAREYRDAIGRAATASRQAVLLSRLLDARGIAALKGDEPADLDELVLDAGRRSLQALEGAVVVA